jgi:hypothetical protein
VNDFGARVDPFQCPLDLLTPHERVCDRPVEPEFIASVLVSELHVNAEACAV